MSTGVIVSLLIFAFVLGSIMSLKPSAKQKALGKLRERGRILGLQPKLVACPEWLINAQGEKGKGMVALYGLVLDDAKLPKSHALVLESCIEVVEGENSLNGVECPIADALGVTMQANFMGIYIKETLSSRDDLKDEMVDARLTLIKQSIQNWAIQVQA